MKNEFIAIPVFQERISPLLDEARRFILIELSEGSIVNRTTVTLNQDSAALRVAKLREIGITTIICGAVSGFLSRIISEQGFVHYSWTGGPVEQVIDLYMSGALTPAVDCGKPCRGTGRSCGRDIAQGRKKITERGNDL